MFELTFTPLFQSNNFTVLFFLHLIAYSRRFLDHDLDLRGTGCYLLPNECSSFWSLFSLPNHFARPSGIRSREWNHSKSDYDMRWAFKAFLIIPLPVSPRFFDVKKKRARKRNPAGKCIANRYRGSFLVKWYLKSLYDTRSEMSCSRVNVRVKRVKL